MMGKKVTPKIEFWQGESGRWYWHMRVGAKITADGSQSYGRKTDAKKAAKKHIEHTSRAVVTDLTVTDSPRKQPFAGML
jgi:hypothetical protein